MTDDKTIQAPHDANRINLNEDYEVRYWTERFGVAKEALSDAINTVGPNVKTVRAYLGVDE